METIIDIIEFENDVLKYQIEKEYNFRKLSYDKQVDSLKKVCSEKKMNKSANQKELTKLQATEAIDVKKLIKNRLFAISGVVAIGIILIVYGTVNEVFYKILTPIFFLSYGFIVIVTWNDLNGHDLIHTRTVISKIKDSTEKLTIEISTLENQLKSLQENSPKIEDVEKTINTKELFEKNSTLNSRYLIEKSIQNLIGLSINSKQVQEYFKELGGKPEISKYDDCSYYCFKSVGIDFAFSNTNIVDTIFLYAEGVDNRNQYLGYIPYGIRFKHTQKDILQMLGTPSDYGDGGGEKYGDWCGWENKGIGITFKPENKGTKMNTIAHINITQNKTNNIEVQEKFSVFLKSPGISILTVCKSIRDLLEIDLKEAKYIVEATPKVIKEGLWAYEANEIKSKLEEAGAEVEIVKTTNR